MEIEKRMTNVERKVDKLGEEVKSLHKKVTGKHDTNMTCDFCGYSWWSKSKLGLVSCPSCGNKVPRSEKGREKRDKEDNRAIKEWEKRYEKGLKSNVEERLKKSRPLY